MMANGESGQRSGSTAGAIGTSLGVLFRSLTQKPHSASGTNNAVMQGDRLAKGLVAGGRAVVKSTTRVAGILFLQVVGFMFVVLGLSFVYPALRELDKYRAGMQGPGRVITAFLFVLMFSYFGISSFWRARKK
jgi:hypothetical protein